MRKISIIVSLSLVGLVLSGCSSFNVQHFTPDVVASNAVARSIPHKVALGAFTLPANKDKNSIMCRLAGDIYLPNKMTFSQYIKHAFAAQLISANRYASKEVKARHVLSAQLERVDFGSLSGTWTIKGRLAVDRNPPVGIKSETKFGTSYFAMSACENVAKGFEVAVQNFVEKSMSNPTLVSQLRK